MTTTDPNYWPYETQSDLARIRRDHEFLRVLAAAVKAKGLSDPFTDEQLVGRGRPAHRRLGLPGGEMINLVLNYHSVNVNAAPQLTLPVQVDQFGTYYYKGGDYGDIEFPAEPVDRNTVKQFLGLTAPNANTYSGSALPDPSTITVSVLNGSGAYNQATDTSQALAALGFHIGTIGDSPPVGAQAETVVYYAAKTPADLAAAQAVMSSMSGGVIMAMDPTMVSPGSQVTVVTGTDFSVNAPAPPTTTTVAGKATGSKTTAPPSTTTTTATTTPTSSNGAFQAPNPSVLSPGSVGPPLVHADRRGRHLGRPPPSSGEDLPSVGVQRLAGHGPREVRRQVDDRGCHVFVARDPTERHPGVELVGHDLGLHPAPGRRHLDVDVDRRAGHPPGNDRVDPHVGRPELVGQHPGRREQRTLRDGVPTLGGLWLARHHRGHHHDRTTTA